MFNIYGHLHSSDSVRWLEEGWLGRVKLSTKLLRKHLKAKSLVHLQKKTKQVKKMQLLQGRNWWRSPSSIAPPDRSSRGWRRSTLTSSPPPSLVLRLKLILRNQGEVLSTSGSNIPFWMFLWYICFSQYYDRLWTDYWGLGWKEQGATQEGEVPREGGGVEGDPVQAGVEG